MADPISPLTWKIQFSLLTNPNIIKSWLKAMGWTYVLCMVLLIPVFIATGEISSVPMVMAIFAGVVSGLALLGFLIMFLILGNRSHARFTLSDKTILYENMDKKITMLSRMAVMSGGLFGSPTTAGTGLISLSNESVSIEWESISQAKYDSKHLTICLKNSFRELLHLYCSEQNYKEVEKFVQAKIAKQKIIWDETLAKEKSNDSGQPFPVLKALFRTILIILIAMTLFALNDILKVGILIPILIMIFSLAMVWIIPLFGWVVLGMGGYTIFQVISSLLWLREYKLVSTYSFRKYEVLDMGEWVIVSLAITGLIYLSWISIKMIKGKMVPILMKD